MLMSKRLETHLQIYDIGQHEARLRWLLLKDFGHHVAYPIPKGVLMVGTWHGTSIIWKHGVWVYWGDVISFMSTIMLLLRYLYDDGVGRQQELLLVLLLLREYGLIFSHTLHDVVGVGDGTIMVQKGYYLTLEDHEVIQFWKESPTYSRIMIDGSDMWYVKRMEI